MQLAILPWLQLRAEVHTFGVSILPRNTAIAARRETQHIFRVRDSEAKDGRAADILARKVYRTNIEAFNEGVKILG
jgi:hypothetical protein